MEQPNADLTAHKAEVTQTTKAWAGFRSADTVARLYLQQGPRAAVPYDAARPAGVSPDPHLGIGLLGLDRVLGVSEAFELGHHTVGPLLAPGILLKKRART